MTAGEPHTDRLLLVIGQNVTSLDEVASDPALVAVAVASALRDTVTDLTGQPWPTVRVPGAEAVAEPSLNTHGRPTWMARGFEYAFGTLVQGQMAWAAAAAPLSPVTVRVGC